MIQPILQTSQGCDHPSSEVKFIFMIDTPTVYIRRDIYKGYIQELFSLNEGGYNSSLTAIFVAGS